jgi:uncharacterized protein involved in cysteine biosynthesis
MDILKSKKFQASIAGVIVVIISSFIPEIDEAELTKIVILIVSYVIGQGLADFGKEGKSKAG